jgi:hypothetical protein
MKPARLSLKWVRVSFALAVAILSTGCESTDGGGSAQVSGGVYYGAGFHDPWYYGDYWDDPDIIVTPPDIDFHPGARPEHPIARPTPQPTPMPSIPSMPRAAPRAGGRR